MKVSKKCSLKIKNMVEHPNSVMSVLYFGSPRNKLVTTGWDSYIRIFDSVSLKCLQKTKFGETNLEGVGVQHLLVWDETHFLACGDYHRIACFTIEPELSLIKIFETRFMGGPENEDLDTVVYRMMKLDEDTFLFINYIGEIIMVDFETHRVIRRLEQQDINTLTRFVLSKRYNVCFYINTISRQNQTIKLINYEKNVIMKSFDNSKFEFSYIYAIDIFFDFESNVETLVCGGYLRTLFFFNTETMILTRKIKLYDFVYFITSVKDRYLSVGDSGGRLYIFDLKKYSKCIKSPKSSFFGSKKVHSNRIFDIKLAEIEDNSMTIITASFDRFVKTVVVGNTQFQDLWKEKQRTEDLRNRIMFLRNKYLGVLSNNERTTVEEGVNEVDMSFNTVIIVNSDRYFVLKSFLS